MYDRVFVFVQSLIHEYIINRPLLLPHYRNRYKFINSLRRHTYTLLETTMLKFYGPLLAAARNMRYARGPVALACRHAATFTTVTVLQNQNHRQRVPAISVARPTSTPSTPVSFSSASPASSSQTNCVDGTWDCFNNKLTLQPNKLLSSVWLNPRHFSSGSRYVYT
jgi:hypothetical protein